MSALLIAIDPGSVSGAYAVFYDDGPPTVYDLPVVDRQVSAGGLSAIVRAFGPERAVTENVHSMPKQGVASTFRFGLSVGIVHGVFASHGVPLYLVTPHEWKRGMRLSSDKEQARALATRLFPMVEGLHLKKHQGRAEALLLGHYFMLKNRE